MELLKDVNFITFLGFTLCTLFVCIAFLLGFYISCKNDETLKRLEIIYVGKNLKNIVSEVAKDETK